jgi:hypothetical protein
VPLPVTTLPSAWVSNQPPPHTIQVCHRWPAGLFVQVREIVRVSIRVSWQSAGRGVTVVAAVAVAAGSPSVKMSSDQGVQRPGPHTVDEFAQLVDAHLDVLAEVVGDDDAALG